MSSISLIDWLFTFLGLKGTPSSGAIDLDNTLMEVNPDHGTVEHFVVTPCGYRIRVPQTQDVSHSVGELLPEVRQSLAQIPPLPRVVVELLREVQSESSTANSVANIASSDPVLAAALLRTVNSSALGLKRKITSVTEAVSYLGFGLVKSVLLRLRLDETLPTAGQNGSDAEDLWVHALAVSYVAEVLADRIRGVDRGFVSTLGLLHDIGKLAMLSQKSLKNQMALTPTDGEDNRTREARLLGADHAGLGASLAHTWGLPSDLVQAIRFHHHPENAYEANDPLPLRQAAYVVFIANQLVKLCFAHSDEMAIDAIPESAAKVLGIKTTIDSLLDDRVRQAVGRAILFTSENTKQNKTAVRRLIKLRFDAAAMKMIAAAGESAPTRVTLDDATTAEFMAKESDAATVFRASGTTRDSDIAKLIDAGLFHQSKIDLPAALASQAAEVLRCLLPNLALPLPDRVVDLVQHFSRETFTLGIRSEALKFASRVDPLLSPEDGAKLVANELANVMNLGWVSSATVSLDGSTIVLTMK
jgi:putative nucleotidyltransferase with HDIG domain